MEDHASYLIRRYDQLAGLKQNFMNHWQDIVDYMMPYRQGITVEVSPGVKRMDKIFDSSPLYAHFLFAAELHSIMTNPSSPWFTIGIKERVLNNIPEVQVWRYEAAQALFDVLNASNFATQVNEGYLDFGGFGLFVMFITEDNEDTVSFNTLNLGEVVIGEDSKGRVDTFMRQWDYTARQAVQEFGIKNVSEKIVYAMEKTPDKKFRFIHAVYPRGDRDIRSRLSSQMPIASIYMERESKKICSEKGFQEFPVVAPRFSVATGEVYGRGPGMIALPDVKQLNQMEEDMMRAAQKKIDPPIMYAKDSFTGPVRFQPGGTTIVRGTSVQDKMAPFPVPGDLGYGEKLGEIKREQIGRTFFKDLITVVQSDRMTAQEFMGRQGDKWRLMGPMLGRMQFEFLKPMVHRVLGIMHRRGQLPPIPEPLLGQKYTPIFTSPLAMAQRLQEAQGISRTMEILMPVMQFKPEIADNIDWDQVTRIITEVNSVPATVNVPPETVAQVRQARAQAQQQQMDAAHAQEAAKTIVPALAKGGSPGSPLEAIMNTMKGTAQAAQPELGTQPAPEV
jgi:hypothetical protein